jgi:hypothetical protein
MLETELQLEELITTRCGFNSFKMTPFTWNTAALAD